MNTPCRSDASDVTEAVLDAMLNEALDLTDEIAAVGGLRRATAAPDSFDCALRLRMAARLSRIAAWASLRVSDDPERLAIADAALQSAAEPIRLDGKGVAGAAEASDLAPFVGLVDRVVERAQRLEALLSGAPQSARPDCEVFHSDEGSAQILPFRKPVVESEEATAERVS